MESQTYLKNLRISPKKMRFLLPEIKKLKPRKALDYLFYAPEKTARVFYKAIHSALSNAKQSLKVDEDLLKFKVLTVEEGQKIKRFKAGGRGTAKPIVRRFSHIKIVLEAETPETKTKKTEIKASKQKVAKKNILTKNVRKNSKKA